MWTWTPAVISEDTHSEVCLAVVLYIHGFPSSARSVKAVETKAWPKALDKYSASRQIVECGGDHRFRNYHRHLPAILEFLQLP